VKKSLITKEFDHWQLNRTLTTVLRNTAAKETTRFAISYIYVGKNELVATDGRKLVIVKTKHDIKKGLYHLTKEGFLLSCSPVERFPKYKTFVLDSKKSKTAKIRGYTPKELFNEITFMLHQADIRFDSLMLKESLFFAFQHASNCTVETIGLNKPFQVCFDLNKAKIVYVQMPLLRETK